MVRDEHCSKKSHNQEREKAPEFSRPVVVIGRAPGHEWVGAMRTAARCQTPVKVNGRRYWFGPGSVPDSGSVPAVSARSRAALVAPDAPPGPPMTPPPHLEKPATADPGPPGALDRPRQGTDTPAVPSPLLSGTIDTPGTGTDSGRQSVAAAGRRHGRALWHTPQGAAHDATETAAGRQGAGGQSAAPGLAAWRVLRAGLPLCVGEVL